MSIGHLLMEITSPYRFAHSRNCIMAPCVRSAVLLHYVLTDSNPCPMERDMKQGSVELREKLPKCYRCTNLM